MCPGFQGGLAPLQSEKAEAEPSREHACASLRATRPRPEAEKRTVARRPGVWRSRRGRVWAGGPPGASAAALLPPPAASGGEAAPLLTGGPAGRERRRRAAARPAPAASRAGRRPARAVRPRGGLPAPARALRVCKARAPCGASASREPAASNSLRPSPRHRGRGAYRPCARSVMGRGGRRARGRSGLVRLFSGSAWDSGKVGGEALADAPDAAPGTRRGPATGPSASGPGLQLWVGPAARPLAEEGASVPSPDPTASALLVFFSRYQLTLF